MPVERLCTPTATSTLELLLRLTFSRRESFLFRVCSSRFLPKAAKSGIGGCAGQQNYERTDQQSLHSQLRPKKPTGSMMRYAATIFCMLLHQVSKEDVFTNNWPLLRFGALQLPLRMKMPSPVAAFIPQILFSGLSITCTNCS
jgi:hypothetical protein